jgi:hypothetical protein
MSFAPGQFITAQRLNRLQTKSYFSQCSGTVAASGSGDVPGTAISIPIETNGATATFSWTASTYYLGLPSGASSTHAVWDVNSSPTFAVNQQQANTDKVTGANFWSTTIPTAGTYTFKLAYSTLTNTNLSIYTAMIVQIDEVA